LWKQDKIYFFEDNEVTEIREIDLEEKRVCAPSPTIQEIVLPFQIFDVASNNTHAETNVDPKPNANSEPENDSQQEDDPQNDPAPPPSLRRTQHERNKAIPDDYITYMSEDINDVGKVGDPPSYKEAMKCENSSKWVVAMEDELKSMGIMMYDTW
jgi:hypothetical protein